MNIIDIDIDIVRNREIVGNNEWIINNFLKLTVRASFNITVYCIAVLSPQIYLYMLRLFHEI
jgi:hypothetical protein